MSNSLFVYNQIQIMFFSSYFIAFYALCIDMLCVLIQYVYVQFFNFSHLYGEARQVKLLELYEEVDGALCAHVLVKLGRHEVTDLFLKNKEWLNINKVQCHDKYYIM